jgi:hypothetical protein
MKKSVEIEFTKQPKDDVDSWMLVSAQAQKYYQWKKFLLTRIYLVFVPSNCMSKLELIGVIL